MNKNLTLPDVTIYCGLLALVIFSLICISKQPASASVLHPLLLQGGGMAYGQPVDENVGPLESNARMVLYELGSAEASYSSRHSRGEYTFLQDLMYTGLVLPNNTGSTLAQNYSITFYLPPGRRGFTLIAEPKQNNLRPFMITENQDVVLLTPSVMNDPTEDWAEVRDIELNNLCETGRYNYISSLQLINYDPILDVRLNREMTRYVIHSLINDPTGRYFLDDSLVYVDAFAAYMIGDTRNLEW